MGKGYGEGCIKANRRASFSRWFSRTCWLCVRGFSLWLLNLAKSAAAIIVIGITITIAMANSTFFIIKTSFHSISLNHVYAILKMDSIRMLLHKKTLVPKCLDR